MASAVQLASLANGVLTDASGTVRSNVSVYVYLRGTTTQVSVFSDSGLTQGLSQPLTTTSLGAVPGYVASGQSVDVFDPVTTNRGQAEPVSAVSVVSNSSFKRLVEDFGADATGTNDSSTAIANAAASALPVYCTPGTYLCNNVALNAAARFFSNGNATFKKNGNGPVFTVNAAGCRFFGCNIDGNGGSFTGVGISMAGATSTNDFRWLWGDITNTASYCVEWPNSNTGARETFAFGTFFVQGLALPAFHFAPTDTNATDRALNTIWCQGGQLADFNGCQTVIVTSCDCSNVIFGTGSKKVTMTGCRVASSGADTTVFGTNHTIVGNTHAGRFVIDSTAASCVVGPNVTVNQSVNNSSTCSLITAYGGNTLPEYSRSRALPGYITPQTEAMGQISQSSIVGTANLAYLNRLVVSEPTAVIKIAFYVSVAATANDNIDLGIYNSAGTLLSSQGSTAALVNSTGLKVVTLTTSVTLLPGQVYWIAFAYGTVGGTAATLQGVGMSTNNLLPLMGTGNNLPCGSVAASFPLPASITVGQGALNGTPTLAARTS